MALTKVSYSMIEGASVNVIDFGVTGNGTTDDSAALQLALNSVGANGGLVIVPSSFII
jgi:polygalacturonase